jgi:hypothetical protein
MLLPAIRFPVSEDEPGENMLLLLRESHGKGS